MDDLAASDFSITVEQRIRAYAIFVSLCMGSPNGVPPAERLANFIGPIVCRSAEEQLLCHRIFAYWFPVAEAAAPTAASEMIMSDAATSAAARSLEGAVEAARRRRIAVFAATGVLALLIAFGLAVLTIRLLTPQAAPLIDTGDPGLRVTTTTTATTARTQTEANQGANAPAAATPVIGETVTSYTAPWLRSLEDTLGPLAILVLMIPFTALALLLLSSRRLLAAYVRQTRVVPREEVRLLLSGDTLRFEPEECFFRNVQPLRRRVEGESMELDINRTIAATIDGGGIFTAIFARSFVTPDYLILVDERGAGDHLAAYASLLVKSLELAGVSTTVYSFDRDPRRLYVDQAHSALDFRDLVGASETQRLFVFSDGEGWIDPALGRPYEWAPAFDAWADRFLFTPKSDKDWAGTEWWFQSRLGFNVLPATAEGLRQAATAFEGAGSLRNAPPERLLPDRERLAGFFAIGNWKWLDEAAPEKVDLDGLMLRLRRELSDLAFTWLCAIAVYPSIDWRLTTFLGARIAGPGREEKCREALLEIARLPWLQRSRMPLWLREQLIHALGEPERKVVQAALDALFFTTTTEAPKNLALSIGAPAAREAAPLPDLGSDELTARDHIIIEFLEGGDVSTSDFRLQQSLLRRLGLADSRSTRDLFGRDDLRMMHGAAAALNRFVKQYPAHAIVVELPSSAVPLKAKAAPIAAHAFLSYAQKDADAAAKVSAALATVGIRCRAGNDATSSSTGQSFSAAIEAAITLADVFVLIYSGAARESTWVRAEIEASRKAGKRLVVIGLDAMPLTSDSPLDLAIPPDSHWFDASERPLEARLETFAAEMSQMYPPKAPRGGPPEAGAAERAIASGQACRVREWIDASGAPAEPPGKVLLLSERPKDSLYRAVDATSLAILRRRQRIALILGAAGFCIFSLVMAFGYARFFETVSGPSGLALVSVIVYAPLLIGWLVLTLPAARALKRFPVISNVTILGEHISEPAELSA